MAGHCLLYTDSFIHCIGVSIADDDDDSVQNNIWRLNIDKQVLQWEKVASSQQKSCVMGGAVFYEALFVAGGWSGKEDMAFVEFYQRPINEWKISTPL